VSRVGPDVTGLQEGDHIVASFIAACGKCHWCVSGMQNLCDKRGFIMTGSGSGRFHGVTHLMDGILQLMRRSGPLQVDGAEEAVVTVGPRPSSGRSSWLPPGVSSRGTPISPSRPA
jgi:Zn-dependent alcohol dehydrogenase